MKLFRRKYIVPLLVIIGVSGYFLKCSTRLVEPLHYFSYYNNVTGLSLGSQVTLRGVSVGKISDIGLIGNDSIRVTIEMRDEDQMLHSGAVAKLISNSLMGGKEMQIIPGTEKSLLPSGTILPSAHDTSLIEDFDAVMHPLITNAKYMLASLDTGLRGFNKMFFSGLGLQSIQLLIELDSNTKELAKVAKSYNNRSAGISKSIQEFDASSRELSKSTAGLKKNFKETADNLQSLSKQDLAASAKKMSSSVSSLSAMVKAAKQKNDSYTKESYQQLDQSLDSLHTQMRTLRENGR